MATASTGPARVRVEQAGLELKDCFLGRTGSGKDPHRDSGGLHGDACPGSHAEADHGSAAPQQADEPAVIVRMGMRVPILVGGRAFGRGLVVGADFALLDPAIPDGADEEGRTPPKVG